MLGLNLRLPFYKYNAAGSGGAADAFTMKIDTTKAGSAVDTFILPLDGSSTYNFTVDWGDDVIEEVTTNTSKTHQYSASGIYNIKITGVFPHIHFNGTGDQLKLLDVSNWGNIAWETMDKAFKGCANATFTARDTPDFRLVTNMDSMFMDCASFNQTIATFNTSNVVFMYQMFRGCTIFNQSVARLNTSKVITMGNMFILAEAFNQSVANFDTSKVTNMGSMFNGCLAFNQSVANFDTSKVTNMGSMFENCKDFNQSVANFDTSKVTYMRALFYQCDMFNQSLATWDTALVDSMELMFNGADTFNQDLSNFDIASLTIATSMLSGTAFDVVNYDLLLVAWEQQVEKLNVVFSAGLAKYNIGPPADAKLALEASGWIITDGGPMPIYLEDENDSILLDENNDSIEEG